ncbi:MAG: BCCT family transporter [Oceanospirillaceae bacterium]
MTIKKAITELEVETSSSGFYQGFNQIVTVGAKILVILLVIWAAMNPEGAGSVLSGIKNWSFTNLGAWYIYVMGMFVVVCFVLALVPSFGKVRLGQVDDRPEFSYFSWVSMMFGAGIGIGMMTYATAEPLYHFANNPDTILGLSIANNENNVLPSMKWAFFHWGLSAWGCYAMIGVCLAFFSYNRGLPLTIRSALTPLFGKSLEGPLGHVVDISAVIATVLGVAVTVGFGVSQYASGIYEVFGFEWLLNEDKSPSTNGMLFALVIVMGLSIVSAMSGVGKGIKWLSNINMGLSAALIAFFVIFGSTALAFSAFFEGTLLYLSELPVQLFTYWGASDEEPGKGLHSWQSGWWTVFIWAWWIAFAPFVGLFLARISKGRTIREFIIGAMIAPTLVSFVWFAFLGGTAIDLELTGKAAGAIAGAGQEAQLFMTLKLLVSESIYPILTLIVLVLLTTFLVTSADSAILCVNTINSVGVLPNRSKTHIIIWGVMFTAVIGVLLVAGGLGAIKSAMIIAAVPFSVIMALMTISLLKALINDLRRENSLAALGEEQNA